ncbi:helix-turn-helix transcriptional regulator [Methylogaea oryzae]|uniref:helix-turn-helix transcriptional regulator n=1 Tax=Methylogaea oryzae TaxID=1295382 RepID=UPI000A997535|nr:hypothetical protein [Methylogaea oryzae]
MRIPAHPGEVLREFIPPGMTVGEAARQLQVSLVQLSRLANGRAAMTAVGAPRCGVDRHHGRILVRKPSAMGFVAGGTAAAAEN